MSKEVILNFQVDKPTANNHIYPREELIKALDEAVKKKIPILSEAPTEIGISLIKNTVGFLEGYSIDEEGNVKLITSFVNTEAAKTINLMESVKKLVITTAGIGMLNDKKIEEAYEVYDYKITSLFYTDK